MLARSGRRHTRTNNEPSEIPPLGEMPDWADGWAVGDWKRSRRVRVARAKGRQGVGSPWCPGGRACGRIVDASGDLDRFLGRWHGSIPLCAGWSGGANYRAFARGNAQFCARNVQSGGFCRRPPVVPLAPDDPAGDASNGSNGFGRTRGEEDHARVFVGRLAACCFARASAVGQVSALCCELGTRFPLRRRCSRRTDKNAIADIGGRLMGDGWAATCGHITQARQNTASAKSATRCFAGLRVYGVSPAWQRPRRLPAALEPFRSAHLLRRSETRGWPSDAGK